MHEQSPKLLERVTSDNWNEGLSFPRRREYIVRSGIHVKDEMYAYVRRHTNFLTIAVLKDNC